MFLLKNAIKGETYVYFAVQKREGKKTRPVRVKSFGKLSELLAKDPDALAHLQEELDRINASPEKSESVVYNSLKERGTDTDCCGNIVLLSEIKRLGLPGIFGGIRTESGFDTARIASDLVCERILDPRSKLASYRKISGNPFYQAGYGINDVYRSLDKIDSFSGGESCVPSRPSRGKGGRPRWSATTRRTSISRSSGRTGCGSTASRRSTGRTPSCRGASSSTRTDSPS